MGSLMSGCGNHLNASLPESTARRHWLRSAVLPIFLLAVVWGGLGSAGLAFAQSAAKIRLEPRAFGAGQEALLTVEANGIDQLENIADAVSFASTCNLKVIEIKPSGANQLVLRLQAPDDILPVQGINYLRIVVRGAASEWVAFAMDHLPNAQAQLNEIVDLAESSLPAAVVGNVSGDQQIRIRFATTAGQRLAFEAESARLGSSLRVDLRLLDSNGKQLQWAAGAPSLAGDCQFTHSFAEGGNYELVVQDQLFKAPGNSIVRIKIGDPEQLGWQPGGQRSSSEFAAGIAIPREFETAHSGWRESEFSPAGGRVLAETELTEWMRDQDRDLVELPLRIDGEISVAGERDLFEIPVPEGRAKYWIRLESERAGTIDPVLRILDARGRQLAKADDSAGSNSAELVYDKPQGTNVIRVEASDLLNRSGDGYGYRLLVGGKQRSFFKITVDTNVLSTSAVGRDRTALLSVERNLYDGPIDVQMLAERGISTAQTIPAGFKQWYLQFQLDEPVGKDSGSVMDANLARIVARTAFSKQAVIASNSAQPPLPQWVRQLVLLSPELRNELQLELVELVPSMQVPHLYYAKLKVKASVDDRRSIALELKTSVPVQPFDKKRPNVPVLAAKQLVIPVAADQLVGVPVLIPEKAMADGCQILFAGYRVDDPKKPARPEPRAMSHTNILELD